MKKLNFYFTWSKYKILRFIYIFMLNKNIKVLYNFLEIIIIEFLDDLRFFKLYLKIKKQNYLKLKLWKHFFIISFIILGLIPLILAFIISFICLKYIIKYLFIFVEYWLIPENNSYSKIFLGVKYNIFCFFDYIPYILKETFRYLFKNNWTRFFLSKIKDEIAWKKYKFLKNFYKKTDYFLLIYIPKKYIQLCNFIENSFIWLILTYFKNKKRLKNFYLLIKNFYKPIKYKYFKYQILYRKVMKYKYKFKLRLRLKLKFRRNFYYSIFYYKKTHLLFYIIWWRKFLFSEAFRVTIYAFFFVIFHNTKASIKYIFIFIKQITYEKLTNILYLKTRFKFTLNMKVNILKSILEYKWLFNLSVIKTIIQKNIINLLYNIIVYKIPIFYFNKYFWIKLNYKIYFTLKSFKSLTYWNIKFYSIIIKFFKRNHPKYINLFIYNIKFIKFLYNYKINYLIINFKNKIFDIYSYIKLTYFFSFLSFVNNNFVKKKFK
jgi:hypothetical protein